LSKILISLEFEKLRSSKATRFRAKRRVAALRAWHKGGDLGNGIEDRDMISVLVNLSEGDVVAGYLGEQVYPVAGTTWVKLVAKSK